MAEDNVPSNPSPTSDHKVSDLLNSNVEKLNILNLEDAKLAGSESCTLILTQGDSAKYIHRGSSLMSQNKYGVFPLQGKLLNVREASDEELLENTEIQNIKKILGLQDGKSYQSANELRYGHLIIMAYKDDDGLNMIGLLINFLHYFCPSLLKVKGFMRMFIPPIVHAVNKETNEVFTFYTIPEYQAWKEKLGDKAIEYKMEYYKGAELTIKSEGAEYFNKLIKVLVWEDFYDGLAIEMAFSRKIGVRNMWLITTPKLASHIDSPHGTCIRYSEFINIYFKQYVVADLQRSIPSMVDGLKPVQRKILFYAFKKPIIQEIEVGQFSAYVFEHSPTHQGEASLVSTIIGMAQDYVGSNNINLLEPLGHFGTRLAGGKDHVAGGRGLFTQLSSITRYIFHEDDELILNYLNDDIEPAWFSPIIPMVLVNGSEGRGTECSSFIPNYNPRDIIANLKRLINAEAVVPMRPWYRGFNGDIQKEENQKTASKDILYTTKGIIKVEKNVCTITELPVGKWTQDYKEFLEAASQVGKDIKAYRAHGCDPNNVDIEVTMTDNSAKQEGVFSEKLQLTTILSTANMHVLNKKGELKKYDTPEQILEDFYDLRLDLYKERMKALIRKLKIATRVLENKVKFIDTEVCEKEIALFPLMCDDLMGKWCDELKGKGLKSLPSIAREFDDAEETEEEEPVSGYDYLLSTPIASFTLEKIKELKQEIEEKNELCRVLQNTNVKSLWIEDLEALDSQLVKGNYPLTLSSAKKGAPATQAQNAAGPQRKNKKRRMQ